MVYVIHAEGTDLYKIGYGINAKKRIAGIQTSCPHDLSVIKIYKKGTVCFERELHEKFRDNRTRGEWFTFTEDEIKKNFRVSSVITKEAYGKEYKKRKSNFASIKAKEEEIVKTIVNKKAELDKIIKIKCKKIDDLNKTISGFSQVEADELIIQNETYREYTYYLCLYIKNDSRDGENMDNDLYGFRESREGYDFWRQYRGNSISTRIIHFVLCCCSLVMIQEKDMYFDFEEVDKYIEKYRDYKSSIKKKIR